MCNIYTLGSNTLVISGCKIVSTKTIDVQVTLTNYESILQFKHELNFLWLNISMVLQREHVTIILI